MNIYENNLSGFYFILILNNQIQININRIIILFFYLAWAISCSREANSSAVLIEDGVSSSLIILDIPLTGLELPLKSGKIQSINIYKDKLIIKESNGSHILTVYSLKEGTYTGYGSIGEGPGKIPNPEFCKLVHVEEGGSVMIFDFLTKKIYRLSLMDNTLAPLYTLSREEGAAQSGIWLGDSILALADPAGDPIRILDLKSDKSIPASLELPFRRTLTPEERMQWYPKDLAFNTKHRLLLTWSIVSNTLSVNSTNGYNLKDYQFGANQNLDDNQIHRNKIYYYDGKTSGDWVYALYGGFDLNGQFLNKIISHIRSELHLYDLKGDTLRRFRLDRLVNTCAIDFTGNCIYCIQEGGKEDKPLVKYEMD